MPGTPTQQAKVKEVVKQWETVANLKFQFIENGRDAIIRIAFQRNNGSWSYVGKGALSIPRTQATMNFGWVYDRPGITGEERGVILHEFGHAIGYLHEHQSPRRGEKLTLNEAGECTLRLSMCSEVTDCFLYIVIIQQMKVTQRPPWSEAQTRSNILNVYSQQEVSNFSEVDFASIMM